MPRRIRFAVPIVAFILVLLVPLLARSSPAASYHIVSLEALQVTRLARQADTVAGSRLVNGQQIAFLLNPLPTNLGTLPDGRFSRANGVFNERVVGYSGTGPESLFTHPFVWTQESGMVDLGTTGDASLSAVATAVNATDIVGYGETPDGAARVPLRRLISDDAWTILATLGGPDGHALALNQAGLVVGDAQTAQGQTHAALWRPDGSVLDLQDLAGTQSSAADINDASPAQIVGTVITAQGARGYVRTETAGMTLLPPLSTDSFSRALGLNDVGDIVGRSEGAGPLGDPLMHQGAVLWTNGQPLDLSTRVDNLAGWTLEAAVGIGNGGVILGIGTFQGILTGFLLIPVPEAVVAPAPVQETPAPVKEVPEPPQKKAPQKRR